MFVAVARDIVFLPKLADPKVISNCCGVVILLSDCPVGFLEDSGSYEIVRVTAAFNPGLAYLVVRRSLEVDWERRCLAIEDPYVHYGWNTSEAFGLYDQQVPEGDWFASGQIVYDERRLEPVAANYKAEIQNYTLDDARVLAHLAFCRDLHVVSQLEVEQVAINDELAGKSR